MVAAQTLHAGDNVTARVIGLSTAARDQRKWRSWREERVFPARPAERYKKFHKDILGWKLDSSVE
jgi:hypothetical protein